jgi:alpha-amylase/alpha-mannosidase (GH57 family)
MATIYLCFVWHMHQPFYKDLISGEYHLPWTRMHALKDYYGMVKLLEDFPHIRQTFNLVPSMMVQIEEYAEGKAADPFLRAALKPAEELTEEEHSFILRYFFQANPHRMIRRYQRYGELLDGWRAADRNPLRARQFFTPRTMRDLQVLSQLAWFDEEFLAHDPEVRALVAKGRDYSLEDQQLMGRKQIEILGKVIPTYREFAARGQIEITTTPFYHPILPLLCDTNIAGVSHPFVPLPPAFRYPQDARCQLERARDYMKAKFDHCPRGLWPSEGSVSDEVFTIAADLGFQWTASDNGVLTRTLGQIADVAQTYRPYLWEREGRRLHVIFRDHFLSDLIGFVYSRMDSSEAASHFVNKIRANCSWFQQRGEDCLVPIILDGENAWEYYEENGRPFLREVYRQIQSDPVMEAVTVSEALERVRPAGIDHIFPGSWINANFDIWIGSDEDNRAWEMLLKARQTYDRVVNGPEGARLNKEQRDLAFEEILIAEGSDWCWWYGPEHHSENRVEFDHLFRSHLANVYRLLGLTPPEELSRPILRLTTASLHLPPEAPLRKVTIDGEVSSYFEWMGAGVVKSDDRQGAMHGQRYLLRELHYGSDGDRIFLRLDLREPPEDLRLHLNFETAQFDLLLRGNGDVKVQGRIKLEAAYKKILEIAVPLKALKFKPGATVPLQASLWSGALPMDAVPLEGWLRIPTGDPGEWPL